GVRRRMGVKSTPESMGHVRAGGSRPRGVTPGARSRVLPDVPTIAESGLPGYDTGVWWGFLAPAGLPPEIKAKLAKDCADAVRVSAVSERPLGAGGAPDGSPPQGFDKLVPHAARKAGAPATGPRLNA